MKNNKGFSLVELIVVIAIMAILAAVAIPTFAHFINKANNQSDAQFVADVKYAIELANAEFDKDATGIKVYANTATGAVTKVEYTIDGHTVIVAADGSVTSCTPATGSDPTDCKYKAAAAEIDKIVDLSAYKVKSSDLTKVTDLESAS